MRVGFLGLGAIGAPMAAHLALRETLSVWNRTRARAEAFASEYPARVAATPADAALKAQAVVTCLPTSADVESLLDGPDGLLGALADDALLIDCTSGDPAGSRRIAARLAERGIGFADAPVSGGPGGARAGTLTVMVGADTETFARAKPVLEAFGQRIEHVGPVGAGHALKAVNNALLAVNIIAAGEGIAAVARAGVPPRLALDVLNASSGASFATQSLIPERVLTGFCPGTFRLALLEKDVGIAGAVVEEAGLDGAVFRLAHQLLGAAGATLGDEADYLDPIRLAEERAGVEIRG